MITRMGAWGPGLFEDDTALDIQGEYERLLRDKVPDDEAERRIIESWIGHQEDELAWVVIAVCESQVGRLTEETKAKALAILDDGFLMRLYADLGGQSPDGRRTALEGARAQLTGPQRKRKTLRKQWAYVTDLEVGALLSYTDPDGWIGAAVVIEVEEGTEWGGTNGIRPPHLVIYDWAGRVLPSDTELARLPYLLDGHVPPYKLAERYRPSRTKKSDPDWNDVGLVQERSIDLGGFFAAERVLVRSAAMRGGVTINPLVGFTDWTYFVMRIKNGIEAAKARS